jgi:hypothetical protein
MKLPSVAAIISVASIIKARRYQGSPRRSDQHIDNWLVPSDAKDRIRHEEVGRRSLISVPDMRTLRLGSSPK